MVQIFDYCLLYGLLLDSTGCKIICCTKSCVNCSIAIMGYIVIVGRLVAWENHLFRNVSTIEIKLELKLTYWTLRSKCVYLNSVIVNAYHASFSSVVPLIRMFWSSKRKLTKVNMNCSRKEYFKMYAIIQNTKA